MTLLKNTPQQVGNVLHKRRLPSAISRFFPFQQTINVNISILTRKTFLLRIKTIEPSDLGPRPGDGGVHGEAVLGDLLTQVSRLAPLDAGELFLFKHFK